MKTEIHIVVKTGLAVQMEKRRFLVWLVFALRLEYDVTMKHM